MKTTTSEPTLAALVALDWADQKHGIALQPAGATTPPECFQLEHRPEVLADWIAQLRERFGGAKVAVALEQKRGALIHALMGHEFLILYPVNPATLANLRKAFHTRLRRARRMTRWIVTSYWSCSPSTATGSVHGN